MIQLYVNGLLCDISDSDILFDYNLENIENPNRLATEVTQPIKLIANASNSIAFGNIHYLGSTGFNTTKKMPYRLLYNGSLFSEGYLKVINITFNPPTYEVVLYSGLAQFFNDLKNKKLNEVGSAAFNVNHTINRHFLKTQWETEVTFNNSGGVNGMRYIPMVQGLYPDFNSSKVQNDNGVTEWSNDYDEWETGLFSSTRQKPALKVSSLIKAISDQGDFQIEVSDTIARSEIFKRAFVTFPNYSDNDESLVNATSKLRSQYLTNVNNIQTNEIDDQLGIFYDNAELDFNYVIGKEVSLVGYKRITATKLVIDAKDANGNAITDNYELIPNSQMSLGITIANNGTKRIASDIYSISKFNGAIKTKFDERPTMLEWEVVDSQAKLYVSKNNPVSYNLIWYDSSGMPLGSQIISTSKVNAIFNFTTDYNISADVVDINSNTNITLQRIVGDDITQFDFIYNFFKIFNPHYDARDGYIRIDCVKDIYDDRVVDITPKIASLDDINTQVIDKAKLVLGWKEDTSNSFFEKYNNKYGENFADKVVNTGYDFTTEKQRLFDTTPFISPLVIERNIRQLVRLNESTVTIVTKQLPCSATIDGNVFTRVESSFQIYLYGGLENYEYKIFDNSSDEIREQSFKYRNDLNYSVSCSKMPKFTKYANGESLDFGRPKINYNKDTDITYPEEWTLYNKYWKNYLSDRYNKDARIITVTMKLSIIDIQQGLGQKFYFYQNQIWRIAEIEAFDIKKPRLVKVKLISVNDINNYK